MLFAGFPDFMLTDILGGGHAMRILYVTAVAYPIPDANVKIALRLAAEMNRRGHRVELLALANDLPPASSIPLNGITVHLAIPAWCRLDTLFKKNQEKRAKKLRHLLACARHPAWTLAFASRKEPGADRFVQRLELLRRMKQLAKQGSWDAVLVQCQPYLAWELAPHAFHGLPLYLHQLDPFADNLHYLPYPRKVALRRERFVLDAASHIFTTPLLVAVGEQGELGGYLSKATAVEFPCLVEPSGDGCASPFPADGALRLVYTGVLNDEYRSPAWLLALCEKVWQQEPRFQLHIFGTNQSECLHTALGQPPAWLFYHGQVPPEQAQAATLAADALVNLGNTYPNMMPSKILDYLATGRPIVNICKLENCPTLRLTEHYPLALNLADGSDIHSAAAALLSFLHTNAGNRLSFSQVEALFPQATPAFVASRMLAVMESDKEHIR